MTAEVIVLNHEAVALAADSTVTSEDEGQTTIYTTVNKLFALSSHRPIAVMIYGGSSFGIIPWETIIKEYRSSLGAKSYDTLEEYADNFIKSLKSYAKHTPRDWQRAYAETLAGAPLYNISEEIKGQIHHMGQRDTTPSKDAVHDLMLGMISDTIETFQSAPKIQTRMRRRLRKKIVESAVYEWMTSIQKLDLIEPTFDIWKHALDLAGASMMITSPFSTGLVFAGFGEQQVFPAWSEFKVDGIIGNKVRYCRKDGGVIGEDFTAQVMPFAQDDIVHAFLTGIHPDLRDSLIEFVLTNTAQTMAELDEVVREKLSPEDYSDVKSKMKQLESRFDDLFLDHIATEVKNSTSRIMRCVDALPKEELAHIAEGLVNLTCFYHLITPEVDTAGGPIDVAVITKADGISWIKHKRSSSQS